MSKLIDYAGLTEFYNKFKEEITAPEIVNLGFQESGWSDFDKNVNIRALSKFETKWKNLHGIGNRVAYFLGRFSNSNDAVSMLFVKKSSEYVAISNIELGDDNDIYDTVTHLYRYALKNTGEITKNEVIYANKQDKLTSGINIKTVNGQSLLGSGDITVKGDVTKCRINANTLVAEPTGNEPMVFKMPLSDVQKYKSCDVVEIYSVDNGVETTMYTVYHGAFNEFYATSNGTGWLTGIFIGDETTTDENKIGFELIMSETVDTVDKDAKEPISSRAVYTALQAKQDKLTIDTSMSDTSTNPVQNKVIKAYIDGLVGNVAAQLAQI